MKKTNVTHAATFEAYIPIDSRIMDCRDADGVKAYYDFTK